MRRYLHTGPLAAAGRSRIPDPSSRLLYLALALARSPHRQPLYPAALAGATVACGPRLRALADVNILVVAASIVGVGFACRRCFESGLAGLFGPTLVATNPFLLESSLERLLTEPLFIALGLAALYALAGFFESAKPARLYQASVLLGLAYLTRPNGLFLFAAAWSVAGLYLLRRELRAAKSHATLLAVARPLGLAVFVFAATTVPSWLPRGPHPATR